MILAFVLGILQIQRRSLWTDELTTVDTIQMRWTEIWSSRLAAGHFPTYFWMLKAWCGVFGNSEWSLRLPSLLLNLGTIVALALFVRGGVGSVAGLCAALIYALHQRSLWASLEARPYALAILMVVLTWLAFARAIERGGAIRCGLLVAAAVGASVTHLSASFSVFVLPLAALVHRFVVRRKGKTFPKGVLVASCLSAVLGLAALFFLVAYRHSHENDGPGGEFSLRYFTEAFGQVFLGEYGYLGGSSLRYVGVALGVFALVLLVISTRAKRTTVEWTWTTLVWLGSSFVFLGASRLTGNVGETFRYYAPAVPAAAAIAGVACAFWARKPGWQCFVATIGCLAAIGSVSFAYSLNPGDGLREAIVEVKHQADSRDIVIAYGPARAMRTALGYYGPLPSPSILIDREERDLEELKEILYPYRVRHAVWMLLYKEETPRGKDPAIIQAAHDSGWLCDKWIIEAKTRYSTRIYRCAFLR